MPDERVPKILIISYLFPPVGGIGVQRALSLAKYLPDNGCELHVLKATNAGGPVQDPALVKQIPASVAVHSALTPELPFAVRQKLWAKVKGTHPASNGKPAAPPRWKRVVAESVKKLLSPEPEILWKPFAVRAASRIIRQHRIDAVLVTVPPFSALAVGTALKQRFPHVRLISDFRDEWLTFYLKEFEFQNSQYTRRRAEAIEQAAVTHSDLVVAVARSSLSEIRRRYPEQPDSKFVFLPNGYDPEVFADFHGRQNTGPDTIVTHIGTVYGTASPRYYLDALDGLPEEIRCRIRTRFVGRVSENERAILKSRKAPLEILGFMPQAEALRHVEETDFLLLNMTNDISLPGKLFEYLAMGKPILAITPHNGEVDQLLRHTGAGWSADPADHEGIQALLIRAANTKFTGTQFAPNREAIRRYERPRLAAEYASILRSLVGPAGCE